MSRQRGVLQARAHEQLGQLLPREKHKHAYDDALKERFKHLPEVKRILRHRHLPTTIYKVCPSPPLSRMHAGTLTGAVMHGCAHCVVTVRLELAHARARQLPVCLC